MSGDPTLERIAKGNGLALLAAGSWTARFAPVLEPMVADAEKLAGSRPNIFIDVSQVSKLDTSDHPSLALTSIIVGRTQ